MLIVNVAVKEETLRSIFSSSIVKYAKMYKDDLNKIANSIRYANLLPPEFSVILLKDYLYLDDNYKSKLLQIPEYLYWVKTKGRLLDAAK